MASGKIAPLLSSILTPRRDRPIISQNASEELKQSFYDLFCESTVLYADDTTKPEPAAHTTVLLDAVTAIGERYWKLGDSTDLTIPNRENLSGRVRDTESTPKTNKPQTSSPSRV